MLKFAFLVNPVSGGGKGEKIFRKISEVLARLSFSPEEFYREFTRPGETVCQAKRLAPITEKLIAVGGDGTVAQVHPSEGLLPAALDMARIIASRAPLAIEATKRVASGVSATAAEIPALAASADHAEARAAFIGKRPAVFRGS